MLIKYSYNWNNKLNCISWSTIRLRNDKKYQKGDLYENILVDRKQKAVLTKKAKIVNICHFTLDKMTEAMAQLDTGYSLPEAKKIISTMYKNKNIDFATQHFSFIVFNSKV